MKIGEFAQAAKPDQEQDEQILIEREGEDILFKSIPLTPSEDRSWLINAQELLDTEIRKRDYQRISNFLTYGKKETNAIQVAARVIPLGAAAAVPMEDIDLPFENDEAVIGKWRVVGEYAVEEDFFTDVRMKEAECGFGNKKKEIYFLPGGQDYWIYGWTKGCLVPDLHQNIKENRPCLKFLPAPGEALFPHLQEQRLPRSHIHIP